TGLVLNAGGKVEKMIGIKPENFIGYPPDEMFKRSHPEDTEAMFAFSNYFIQITLHANKTNYKTFHPTLYIRIKNNENVYKWCMIQYADYLTDDEDNLLVGLGFVTDISHIKTDGVAMMSIVNSEKEICSHYYCQTGNVFLDTNKEIPKVSNREIEVLNYLAIGFSSKQIASELNISIKTVDNHRQNMLSKTNSKSTGELVSFAIKTGYI
ncbi:MAG: response regulator transcription factor, partial [Leadbetterella sp.]